MIKQILEWLNKKKEDEDQNKLENDLAGVELHS